ncbi:MAG: Calx-beta domain-containing protein, partial [Parafilimonas sp.]
NIYAGGTFVNSFGNKFVAKYTPEIILPAISISDKSVTEGNNGTTAMKFKVTLSEASSSLVKVNYKTADSTAKATSDYTKTNGKLKFAAGQTSKTITVFINGDTKLEPNEKLKLILSQPSNATIADGLGIGTIRNDDAAAFTIDDTDKKTEAAMASNISIKVSPNPAKNQITVSGLAAGALNYIELTDLNGHSLLKQKVSNAYQTLDVSKYANGTYMLVYFNGNKMQQVKFIKE